MIGVVDQVLDVLRRQLLATEVRELEVHRDGAERHDLADYRLFDGPSASDRE